MHQLLTELEHIGVPAELGLPPAEFRKRLISLMSAGMNRRLSGANPPVEPDTLVRWARWAETACARDARGRTRSSDALPLRHKTAQNPSWDALPCPITSQRSEPGK